MKVPHPMDGYRLQAVVDWVLLELTLPGPTQGRHLRRRMPATWALPYAKPAAGEDPNSCHVFEVRVQDPNLGLLPLQVRQLGATARVLGLEVALDAYPRTEEARASLAQAAYYLHRHHAHPPPGGSRITWPKHFRAGVGKSALTEALGLGWTINTGTLKSGFRLRCYVKGHDTLDGVSYALLPQKEHRARLEKTLTGTFCPVESLQALQSFRFESLNRMFAMVVPAERISALAAFYQEQVSQLGRPRDPLRKRQRRTKRRVTQRDIEFNDRIREALRQLSNRTATQVKRAKIRGKRACLRKLFHRGTRGRRPGLLNTLIPYQYSTPSPTPRAPVTQRLHRYPGSVLSKACWWSRGGCGG